MCFGSRNDVVDDVSMTPAVSLPYIPPRGSTQSATNPSRAGSNDVPTSIISPTPGQKRASAIDAQTNPYRRRWQTDAQTNPYRRRWQTDEAQEQAETAALAPKLEGVRNSSIQQQVKPQVASTSLPSLPDTTGGQSREQIPSNKQGTPALDLSRQAALATLQQKKSTHFPPIAASMSRPVSAPTSTQPGKETKAIAVGTPPGGSLRSSTTATYNPTSRPPGNKVFGSLLGSPGTMADPALATSDKEEAIPKPGLGTITRSVSSSSSISKVSTVSSVSLDSEDHAIIRKAAVKNALHSVLNGGNDSRSSSDIDPDMVMLFLRKRQQKVAKQAEKVRAKREVKRQRDAGVENGLSRHIKAGQDIRRRRSKEQADKDAEAQRAIRPSREETTGTDASKTARANTLSTDASKPSGVARSTPLAGWGAFLEYKRIEETKKNTREQLGRFAGPALDPITFKQFMEKKAREEALRALLQGVPDSSSVSSLSSDEESAAPPPRDRHVRPAPATTTKRPAGPRLTVPVSVSASETTSPRKPAATTIPEDKTAAPTLRKQISVPSALRKSTTGPIFKVQPLPEFQAPALAPIPRTKPNVPPKYLPDLRLDISARGPDAPGAMSADDLRSRRTRFSSYQLGIGVASLGSDLERAVGSWTSAEWPMAQALMAKVRARSESPRGGTAATISAAASMSAPRTRHSPTLVQWR